MNYFLKMSLLLLVLVITSCTDHVAKDEVERRFEDILGLDIPNNFEAMQSENTYAIFGDSALNYKIRYEQKDFEELIKKIDLSIWDNTFLKESNFYRLDKRVNERTFCGVDLLILENSFVLQCSTD